LAIKKLPAKNFNGRIPNPSKSKSDDSNLEDPRDIPHTQGGSNRAMNPSPEACCMIKGWDQKHLETRVHTSC